MPYPRAYFAYGSNMDADQMRERHPDAVIGRRAELPGHAFVINSRGVATIVPKPGATVHGVLWSISAADEASLDKHEGVAIGKYRKAELAVDPGDDVTVTALVYIDADSEPGRPRSGYLEKIVAAAKKRGLPADYVRELESWGKISAQDER